MRWRLLPHPFLSVMLLILWLLLVNSVAPGQLVLGTLLAVAIPIATSAFWNDDSHAVRLLPLLRYLVVLVTDIIIANFQVARLILGPTKRLQPAFIRYPFELENDFAITVLASTISLTPGTVTADVDRHGRVLLIHALDVDNEAAVVQQIRERYEEPLKEIFGC